MVTGAGRGIGRATALLLAELGAAVVVNDVGTSLDGSGADDAVAAAVARQIADAGGRATSSSASVVEFGEVEDMMDGAVRRFGSLDVLVNCAGLSAGGSIWDLDPELFVRVAASHATGTFNAIRCAAPWMRSGGWGRIVNLVSRAGLVGTTGAAAYAAGKGAVFALTNVAARDLAPFGITVNAVNPTATDTRMVDAAVARGRAAGGSAAAGAERLRASLQPSADVARAIAVLCLEDAAAITGRVFLAARRRLGVFRPLAVDREVEVAVPSLDAVRRALHELELPPLDEPF